MNGEQTDANTALVPAPGLVIALSGHAVGGFLECGLHQKFPSTKYIAVGESTGDLLRAAGLDVVVPGTATSEGILMLAEITRLQPGERVWLLAGEGGRDLLERQLLSQYGVSVVKLELYRRVTRSQPPPVDAQTIGGVVLASQQAGEAFAPLWRDMGGGECVSIIVPSQRVADAAVRAGFTRVHSAHGAGTEAVLTAIEKIAGESR